MNDPHGFTGENLLSTLPIALAGDPKIAAIAQAIAELFVGQKEEIAGLSIYPRIGELDGGLLDILARDFKVDWWDSDYSVEEKRRTLMTSWQVHKTLGTKAAVIKAVTSVYPQAALEEWFEYGGEPYHFRLTVRLSENGWDASRHRQLIEKMQYYKNLRSHREAIKYFLPLVTVENLNRFWLQSLLVRGRFPANSQALSLAAGRIGFSQANAQTVAVRELALRVRQQEREALSLGGLFIRAKEQNLQRLGAQKIAMRIGVVNRESNQVRLTQSNTGWRFNGRQKFNGAKKFNGGIKRSEL